MLAKAWRTDHDRTRSFRPLIGIRTLIASLVLLGSPEAIFATEGPRITLEVHYPLAEADSVSMVWGIGAGWHAVPESQRPPGTVIYNGLMRTPLDREGDEFVTRIKTSPDSQLNYCFQVVAIRDGSFVERWDTNTAQTRDYRFAGSTSERVTIDPKIQLPPPGQATQGGSVIPHVISYDLSEASAVSLFWKVNDGDFVPFALRPPNTTEQGERLKTPMARVGDLFQAELQVPTGAQVEFGFLIERTRTGQDVHIWDGGGHAGYYRSVARPDGSTEIAGKNRLSAKTPGSKRTRYTLALLSMGLTALLLLLRPLMRRGNPEGKVTPAISIGATALSAAVVLVVIRAGILDLSWSARDYLYQTVLDGLAGGYYDLRVLFAVSLVFFIAVTVSPQGRIRLLLSNCFTGLGLVLLAAALFNACAMPLLGGPPNYQWLYYSDFLLSGDSSSALANNLSLSTLEAVLVLLLGFLVLRQAAAAGLRRLVDAKLLNLGALVLVAVVIVYPRFAADRIDTREWKNSTLANPVSSFLGSLITFARQPRLFTMHTTIGDEDFATFEERAIETQTTLDPPEHPIKNVIVYVMESVGARYLDMYGGQYSVMPELSRRLGTSMLFERIYCHAPSTDKTLVSLLTSTYPWISYRSIATEIPAIPLTSLGSVLQDHGYRTAFFNAGDIQRTEAFLWCRDFDQIVDYRNLHCDRESFLVDTWDYMNGVDDECLVDALSQWQSQDSDGRFFAMLWGFQTHYPYFVSESAGDSDPKSEFERYLLALRHTDEVLGKLFRWLDESRLAESTLVVVVADHGEAFGQHGQYGHATDIYEENIHIPLILVNPQLFSGQRSAILGGAIDVAPTITEILGIPPAESWQGQSLFERNRRERVYFFATWANRCFGFREDNCKFIFDAKDATYEIYDLETDPGEIRNLAENNASLRKQGTERLAAWVQYQERLMQSLSTDHEVTD